MGEYTSGQASFRIMGEYTRGQASFRIMGEYTRGPASLVFKELAYVLKHPALTNKRNQEARWVRAALSAYQTFYRNLPTFYNLLGREAADCTEEDNVSVSFW